MATNFEYWFDHQTPLAIISKDDNTYMEWLNIFFDICDKANVKPDKNEFIYQIKICSRKKDGDSDKDKKENVKREAMLPILKENFAKFYPQEKMPGESKD